MWAVNWKEQQRLGEIQDLILILHRGRCGCLVLCLVSRTLPGALVSPKITLFREQPSSWPQTLWITPGDMAPGG